MVGSADMLSCREVVARATDYLEAALDAQPRSLFEAHLAHCAGCRIFLAQMRTAIALVGQLGGEPASSAARERLRDRFRAWKTWQQRETDV